ncbi:hypothetical protein V2G26_003702 [Clonostachys chloroleuca]
MRGVQSNEGCLGCDAIGVQCSRERPVCERCRDEGLDCNYRQDGVSKHNSPQPLTTSKQSETINDNCQIYGVPRSVALKHIEAFFTKIYPCQGNSFLHRGTLFQNFHSGTVDRKLLLAICAAASRFIDDDESLANNDMHARTWAKEAKTLLILEDMTNDTVAAALLLARHEVHPDLQLSQGRHWLWA